VLLTFCATAQVFAPVEKGTTELGAFVGASYGTESFVMGGGNVAYAVTKAIMPYVEFSYFPGLPRTAPANQGSVHYSLSLADFHGGVHIRIPLRESAWVPYLVFGVGDMHNARATYQPKPSDPTLPTPPAITLMPHNNFAFNAGGGVRYYFNQKYGIRFEAKVYKASGDILKDTFSKYEVGFFYQIR
jgi:hypothetical protein